MRSELALRKRKDKWIADAVRVDRSTDELRIFPLALPRLPYLAFCR